jgi:hypothetical protein
LEHVDAFAVVLCQLERKDVLVEKMLELLVGQVDAKLLETKILHIKMNKQACQQTIKKTRSANLLTANFSKPKMSRMPVQNPQ